MRIIGAGLAGLLAAQYFPHASIIEASPKPDTHKALLRFRSDKIARFLGIDFLPVTVRKGIWLNGRFIDPDIRVANWYAQKVIGSLADRSIWNLDPVTRYIAPEWLIEELIARCGDRITWGLEAGKEILDLGEDLISTIPLKFWATAFDLGSTPPFAYQPIAVRRYRIPSANVYQTVYFPAPDQLLYRASITKDILICEYIGRVDDPVFDDSVLDAFGLAGKWIEPMDNTAREFGKIRAIDNEWRRSFIYWLTNKHHVYSLGRYGTWRNILLDEVFSDLEQIQRLLRTGNKYDRLLNVINPFNKEA